MRRWILLLGLFFHSFLFAAQGDSRVLLQGFMWESHQQMAVHSTRQGRRFAVRWKDIWYRYVTQRVARISSAGFDLVWLPPPSQGEGAGYHPQQLHNFNNNYGTEREHRYLLSALRQHGVSPVADLVINHRSGTDSWAVFQNPAWPSFFFCSTDEFWAQDPAKFGNPEDREIFRKNERGGPDFTGSDFPNWPGSRDLDHANPVVRREVRRYLRLLRSLGYGGWRYDMAKGYDPRYVGEYNQYSRPSFSVGEYWDGNASKIEHWVRGSGASGWQSSYAFDFPTYYRLRNALRSGNFSALSSIMEKDTLLARIPAYAVTFIENHDTGIPQQPEDTLPNDKRLMQAYAFLLTHPGVPSVYWKHFDLWGRGREIARLIRIRKAAGIHSASAVVRQTVNNHYIAYVGDAGSPPSLIVDLGYGEGFSPPQAAWQLVARGEGYRIWIRRR